MVFSPALAQDNDSGGMVLTFGYEQTADWTDNLGLAPTSPGATLQLISDLSVGFLAETRTTSFSFDTGFRLRAVNSPGPGSFDFSTNEPSYALGYTYRTVDTTLRLNASFSEGDIAFDTDPLIYLTADGFLDLPVDLADLSGSGNRRSLSYGASFEILQDRPFGLTFGLQVSDIDYGADVTTPELVDITRITGEIAARFDIDGATRADVTLTRVLTQELGFADRELTTLEADLTLTRPTGSLTFGTQIQQVDNGDRAYGFDISRELLMPEGSLTVAAGLTRTTADDLITTGSLSYNRNLPGGNSINARLSRTVTPDSRDGNEVLTSLSLGGTLPLTPVATLGLNAAFVRTDETQAGITTDISSLSATLNYDLTRDWSLTASAGIERRDETGGGAAQSESFSLTLARDFSYRY